MPNLWVFRNHLVGAEILFYLSMTFLLDLSKGIGTKIVF